MKVTHSFTVPKHFPSTQQSEDFVMSGYQSKGGGEDQDEPSIILTCIIATGIVCSCCLSCEKPRKECKVEVFAYSIFANGCLEAEGYKRNKTEECNNYNYAEERESL